MKYNRGTALLVVMLLLALLATLAVAINKLWYAACNRTDSQQSFIQAKWNLSGAEEFAYPPSGGQTDQPFRGQSEAAVGAAGPFSTEYSDISISFQAAQACFNINTLAASASDAGDSAENSQAEDSAVGTAGEASSRHTRSLRHC